ncbi:sugar ABC transporter permease [Pseudarthrobacter sulfonivorans]|uniref:Sugar ABC transporter permease n=1 Tax=Pseudarthrobacter sulfonivorans TaxID=121292 RepID=A0A0U3QIT1_9MICC|nr:carbohydrate ABC transporter permease [Pseudarthrobacter sulfonivorans]ALV41435.1 sugar ABC transporter permease [Pseudarthrobacter sulfonivorans]
MTQQQPASPRQVGTNMRQQDVTRLLPTPVRTSVLILMCALVLGPVLYIVLASLNTDLGVASGEIIPKHLTIENYINVWTTVGLAKGIGNSILIAGPVAVVSAILSVGTAYVLVRFAFKGRLSVLRGLLGLQSIPGTLLLLPVFVLFASAGTYLGVVVIGTRWGMFLTYLTFALPFSTWVMVTYLRGLPPALEEAARIDGASNLGVLFRIIIPLSWPGIVVSGIFAFLLGWNDVLFSSVLSNPETQTAAVALHLFSAAQDGGALPLYGQMMASALICASPVIILYLAFQRYLVGGLTAGGVK